MRRALTIVAGAAALLSRPASAEDRPTDGGLWSFDASDTVASWEEATGSVRVHCSTSGPNVTALEDAANGCGCRGQTKDPPLFLGLGALVCVRRRRA